LKRLVFILFLFLVSCATSPKINILPYNQYTAQYKNLIEITNQATKAIDSQNMGKYRVGLLDTEIPNAVSFANYQIFVTWGLYRNFTNEELLFIMGHEVAHIKLGHAKKEWAVSQGISSVFLIAERSIPGISLLDFLANPLVTRAYSREQEMASDKLSVTSICEKYGESAEEYVNALNKIAAYAKENNLKSNGGGLWDTHPGFEKRIQAITELIGVCKNNEEHVSKIPEQIPLAP